MRAAAPIALAAPLLLAACVQPHTDEAPTLTAEEARELIEPCRALGLDSPTAMAAAFRSHATIDAVTFAAEGGAMACSTDSGGDAVCDVTGPGIVRVGGARGAIAFFDLPAGRTARVSMSHDIARCVLN
jgi:hypothetical protein